MANTRKSAPADGDCPIERTLLEALDCHVAPAARIAVAFSGGLDSTVLLHALADAARRPSAGQHPFALSAVHVHHGLSAHADRWAEACAGLCAMLGVPLSVHRIEVLRASGESLEARARTARYGVFRSCAADVIALAHHADDQAETLLLQLLRGSGPHGLAAMPRFCAGKPALLRPLLEVGRDRLLAYARAHALAWVDDESNADLAYRRNFLRHRVAPLLAKGFPGYPHTLLRAAALQADAAAILDATAIADAFGERPPADAFGERSPADAFGERPPADAFGERPPADASCATGSREQGRECTRTLEVARLGALDNARARNALRVFLRARGLRPPSEARLREMLRQLLDAGTDASVRIAHDGAEIGRHRGGVIVHAEAPPPFERAWQGERRIVLQAGEVFFELVTGEGISAGKLAQAPVRLCSRHGGESLRLGAGRPRQKVKKLLHALGIPGWERQSLPLVWCGESLAAVLGVGVAAEFQAGPREPGWRVRWNPCARHSPLA